MDAAWRHPEFLKIDLKRRIAQSDVIDLGFEWELIDDFVQMVMNLKSVSKHVAVVLLPRNTDWINYSPETLRRLDEVLESIARRTQVEIKNYQRHPQILPQHFDDTTHLSVSDGADLFTRVLAEDYVEELENLPRN